MSSLPAPRARVVSREEAEEILRPYLDAFWQCIVAAWRAWERLAEEAPDLRLPLSTRCRAAFVYDHIVYQARSRFHNNPAVRISEDRGFLLLNVSGRLLIRFKKLDNKRRARNISTHQQLLFSLQLQLPGIPDVTRLIAGYQLDRVQTAIQGVLITCPVGSRLEWFFEIDEPPSAGTVEPFPTPTSGTPPVARPQVRATNIERTEERRQ